MENHDTRQYTAELLAIDEAVDAPPCKEFGPGDRAGLLQEIQSYLAASEVDDHLVEHDLDAGYVVISAAGETTARIVLTRVDDEAIDEVLRERGEREL